MQDFGGKRTVPGYMINISRKVKACLRVASILVLVLLLGLVPKRGCLRATIDVHG
jgi:hypothetical protein